MQMLKITMVLVSVTLTACAKSKGQVNSASAASQGGGNVLNSPQLNAQQAGAVATVISQVVSDLLNTLSGLPVGDFDSGPQSGTVYIPCPNGGGSARASGNATLNVSGSYSAPTAALTAGWGTVTFTDCSIHVAGQSLKLNGTVSLASITASGSASLNTMGASFNIAGGGTTAGNLAIQIAGNTLSCTIAAATTLSANGTFSFAENVSTGNVSATTTGNVCGQAVNQPINFSL